MACEVKVFEHGRDLRTEEGCFALSFTQYKGTRHLKRSSNQRGEEHPLVVINSTVPIRCGKACEEQRRLTATDGSQIERPECLDGCWMARAGSPSEHIK